MSPSDVHGTQFLLWYLPSVSSNFVIIMYHLELTPKSFELIIYSNLYIGIADRRWPSGFPSADNAGPHQRSGSEEVRQSGRPQLPSGKEIFLYSLVFPFPSFEIFPRIRENFPRGRQAGKVKVVFIMQPRSSCRENSSTKEGREEGEDDSSVPWQLKRRIPSSTPFPTSPSFIPYFFFRRSTPNVLHPHMAIFNQSF
jgi:hypothetical protein